MLTLVGRSIARVRWLFLASLLLLAAFQFTLIGVAASFANAGNLESLSQLMPGFFENTLGPALMSFGAMTTIGYFDPLVVMVVVQFAVYLATEPAGEIELGLVDLILARPLPRHRLITRSVLVMTASAVTLTLVMGLSTWLGLLSLAPSGVRWPDARVVWTMMVHLVAMGWFFGAAALAAGAWARRRGAAQAAVALTAVGMYLVDIVAESWSPARPLARFSPFHYYHGAAILRGTANTPLDLSIMIGPAIVGIALAYWQFGRRDLS